MRLAVVVVTHERPWHLRRCLEALDRSVRPIDEIVVVDSSTGRTAEAVSLHFGASYLVNPRGYGHMTESRNIGWRHCTSDVIAFIDDDAFATSDWAAALLDAYVDDSIGAVGGRAIANADQEPAPPSDLVGRLNSDGSLTANFDAPGDRPIDVHHIIGCNMSFRLDVLMHLDGFRADYPGTSLREETDMCFHVIAAGWRILYEPRALVVHVGAPHSRGARFDRRYQYYGYRNHAQLLARNIGFGPTLRSYLCSTVVMLAGGLARDITGAIARPLIAGAGTASGLVAGARSHRRDRVVPTPDQLERPALSKRLRSIPGAELGPRRRWADEVIGNG